MIKRFVSILLVAAQVTLGVPVYANASPVLLAVTVNRTVPVVEPVPLEPQFSNPPTTEEIVRARVFGEPVVPVGGEPTSEENAALAQALMGFRQGFGATRYAALESFLAQHPTSPWRASVLACLGQTYRRDGFYTRSLLSFEQAWTLARNDQSKQGRAVGDTAIANLLDVNLQFGRQAEVERLLSEVDGREVEGPAAGSIVEAREGLWVLTNHHEEAVPSGPLALWRVQARQSGEQPRHPALDAFHATPEGASMAQIHDLSTTVGLGLKRAYRQGDAPVPIPSVAHLKAGHFTAVVGETATHYKLDDAILGGETWVTKQALADESSGYFLIPGAIPSGWRAATAQELAGQRGKCKAAIHEETTGPVPCETCPRGMASYSFDAHRVSLLISDTPVGYDPPRGPAVNFWVGYNHRQSSQPATFTYSNVGAQWSFDWISFVQDDPSNLTGAVKIYLRNGGIEAHNGYDGVSSYQPQRDTRTVLVRTSITPIRYERRLPDGGVHIYSQSDGATSPRRVFLTEVIDPQGQSMEITFDSSLRVVAVTDAIGQVTTLEYGMISDPLKITKVTDPFGRSARVEYDQSGRPTRIIDVIGMVSQFEQASTAGSPIIRSLITPYGRTTFIGGQPTVGYRRWLEATDPLGGRERVEYYGVHPGLPTSDPANTVPAGFGPNLGLNGHASYYWDKRAMALYPGDITKATQTLWAFWGMLAITPHPLTTKKPLENRVWYAYEGNVADDEIGPMARPSKIGRVLDDGTAQVTRFEYNNKGAKTRVTDPVGRETILEYDTNEIDLVRKKQKNGSSYDILGSYAYKQTDPTCSTYPAHVPCKITDTAGQVTKYSYNANGTLASTETPPRGGLSATDRTTSYSYFADNAPLGAGRVQTITEPLGATTSLTYDGYGRVRNFTDPDSYTLTRDYDALDRLTKVTFPDGTFEEAVYNRLDPEKRRDRLGRWSHFMYDALRRVISRRDALGRTTVKSWCTCGSMDKLVDPNGNVTTWERDVQGRVTKESRADSTYSSIVYENTTSRPKQVTDAKGQTSNLSYYADGAIKQVTYSNAAYTTPAVTFTYELGHPRPATMVDGTGTTTFSYHSIGTPPSVGAGQLASIDGPSADDVVSYGYDELGRPITHTIDSMSMTKTFDALHRLSTIVHAVGTFTYGYAGATSRMTSLAYPNGASATYNYFGSPSDRELQEIHHKFPGGATLAKFNYAYDAVGNITAWQQQDESNSARIYDFVYDAADQLTSAVYRTTDATPTVLKRYAYTYDPAGNRTTEQIDDAPLQSAYNNMNRLLSQQPAGALRFAGSTNEPATVAVQSKPATTTSDNQFSGSAQVGSGTSTVTVTATDPANNVRTSSYQVTISGSTKSYTYDNNGNLTQKVDGTDTWGYEWYANDLLARVTKNGIEQARFIYDGLGRRYQKIAAGVTTTYVSDGPNVLRESISGGATYRYVHATGFAEPLARRDQNGAAVFYHADHLGSIVKTTNASGVTASTRRYGPYGNVEAGASEGGYSFGGTEWDPETGLHYLRARYLDVKVGRFISEDPLGFDSSTNFYAYVENRPVSYADPSGLIANPHQKRTMYPWYHPLPGVYPKPGVCGSGWNEPWIPDFGFCEACIAHDACWDNCSISKATCDWRFFYDTCKTGNVLCFVYTPVMIGGGGSAYKAARKHCPPPPPKPPAQMPPYCLYNMVCLR